MRQPAKNSNLYTLNISRASSLRCLKSPVKSCGSCESCRLTAKLNHTKEWFVRCGEPAKRRFILGCVRRFDSSDLLEYFTSLLQTFQYKDFTYMRSRSKPSLVIDAVSAPTNHALDESQLEATIDEYWDWLRDSSYWTKANYMLGLMQLCDTHLLHIVSTKTRTLCERERRKRKTAEKRGSDADEDEYMSLCSYVSQGSEVPDSGTLSTSRISGLQDEQADGTYVSTPSDHKLMETDLKSIDGTNAQTVTPKDQDAARIVSAKSQCSTGYGGSPMFSHSYRSIPPSRQSSTKSFAHMTDFERNFFTEDYMSGDDSDEDYASVDPSVVVVASPSVAYSGVSKYRDFIRCLPVHLSKKIFSLLDKNSLTNCLCISKHWRILAEEVQKDFLVHQLMTEEVMLMQGASAKGMNPRYAKYVPVFVPRDDITDAEQKPQAQAEDEDLIATQLARRESKFSDRDMRSCYDGIATLVVVLEERNVYCGAYNVLVLQDGEDPHRCAHYNGGQLVVSGSYDRRLRLIDASSGKVERTIQGHAGSIRCVLVSEETGTVLSGGYDTSIRSWNISNGHCKCIFRGHRATVLCIALHGKHLASGARDKSVKVWNFTTGKCRRTFRHRHIVLAVDVSDTLVVSGCEGGKVKVWNIESATLVKTLEGHQGAITCLRFDKQHIVTGSLDCYAMAWSAVGKHKKCLQAFRHPKDVLCLEFLFRRVITGSADGKLRIWNMLNGDCLRIIRGNSKNDPITAIRCLGDGMIVNTLSNLLIFNFEAIIWDYDLPPERPEGLGSVSTFAAAPPRRHSRAYVRAQKLMRADTKDSLPARPPSRTVFPHGEVLMANTSGAGNFSKRIVSAPPRLRHQASTVHSIEEHVQRIFSARQGSVDRPQSSPAKASLRKCSARLEVAPTQADSDLKRSMVITQVRQTYPRPPPLPDNRRPHVITRGRSAPAYRTQTLPANRRGWTTSAAEKLKDPENKIMVSAAQAREKVARQRPHSAQVLSNKQASCLNPVKSLSCLNLRTFSGQLEYQEKMSRQAEDAHKARRTRHQRSASARSLCRPVSCVPCVT